MRPSADLSIDNRTSWVAAMSIVESTLPAAPSVACASASVFALLIRVIALLTRRRANEILMLMARKIVQLTKDANPRPTMTAFTNMLAARNIDQGESSCRVDEMDDKALAP